MPASDATRCKGATGTQCFFFRRFYNSWPHPCSNCNVPARETISSNDCYGRCIVCYFEKIEENKYTRCKMPGCLAAEKKMMKMQAKHRAGEELSSSGENPPIATALMLQRRSTAASSAQASDPMEVQQESTEEAAKLKEEVAQLKDIVQVLHGQTIEAAQRREQINFLNQEVAKLNEEVAQLKVNVPVFHEQAAQLREQINFVQARNQEVAELMETVKRMQAQIDGLSQSSWGQQQWDGYSKWPQPWSQA